MNRNEWLAKFEYFDILLNDMLKAIPNFDKRKPEYVQRKYLKYYGTINNISLKILENRDMPYMRLSTYNIENKIEQARELLRIALEKRNIPNELEPLLPRL